ncbi:MAG TPA: CDP-archaeol synthase [Steroidobacter sp.]|uniref:CDP-archaeol synthase n=1 Tax=Steroidobacter sp. TaxID=1978227 RepID=UPI002ED7ED5F
MSTGIETARALALLVTANAVPVIVARLTNERWAAPLDFGCVLPDGERLFGSHKTWRGLASGIVASAVAAQIMQLPAWVGAGFAAVSLLADALSSLVKRRMKLAPGAEFLGVDQLGEALLPLVLFAEALSIDTEQVIIVTLIFVMVDVAAVRLRRRTWQ